MRGLAKEIDAIKATIAISLTAVRAMRDPQLLSVCPFFSLCLIFSVSRCSLLLYLYSLTLSFATSAPAETVLQGTTSAHFLARFQECSF